jgi:hypothetical protein
VKHKTLYSKTALIPFQAKGNEELQKELMTIMLSSQRGNFSASNYDFDDNNSATDNAKIIPASLKSIKAKLINVIHWFYGTEATIAPSVGEENMMEQSLISRSSS